MLGSAANAIVAFSLITAPQATTWESDYGKALSATRNSERPLLVVLTRSNDQPMRLAGDQQLSPQTRAELGAYDLCCVDVTTSYGEKVAAAFRAKKFPYTAIIDKEGRKVIFRKAGQLSQSEWHSTLTHHKKGRVVSNTVMRRYLDPTYCPSCQRGW